MALQFARKRRFPSPFLQSVDSELGPVKPDDVDITSEDLSNIQDSSRLYDKENENPDVQKMRDLTVKAPHLEDYLPSKGRRIASALASGLVTFGSGDVTKGIEVGDKINNSGMERAKEQFTQDLGAANTTAKASQASGALAEKDFSQQQDTETTNANQEERAKEHAQMLGLHYDQLSALDRQRLAQQANWADERKRDQQRLGIESGNLDVRRQELADGGKPQIKEMVDQDPNSSTFGKTVLSSLRPKDIKPGTMAKISGQEEGTLSTVNSVLEGTKRLSEMLKDPDVAKDIGAAAGRGQKFLEYLGTSANPKTQEAGGILQLLADIHAKALAARGGTQMFNHLEQSFGRITEDPEMVQANLRAMAKNAVDIGEGIVPNYKEHNKNHPLLQEKTNIGTRGPVVAKASKDGKNYIKYQDGSVEEVP